MPKELVEAGEPLYWLPDYAKSKNSSVSTLYKEIREGRLRPIKIGAKTYISRSEDERYCREAEARGAAEVKALGEQKRAIRLQANDNKKAALEAARRTHKKGKGHA